MIVSNKIKDSKNRELHMSTATMLTILHRIRDYLKSMIVTCKEHVPNHQLESDEEDKPEDEETRNVRHLMWSYK